MAGRLNANGFSNSPAAAYAQGQIRQQGATDLTRNQTALDVQNQQMANQQQMGFGQILAQLFGQDAGSRGLYAQLQSQRQAPIYPANFKPGQVPGTNDPFKTPAGKFGAPTGIMTYI
jgi:hypothetical protein